MKQSEGARYLLAELVNMQAELPTIPKSSKAYGYMYADLDTIVQIIKPILAKHGIGYMQSVEMTESGGHTLLTRVFDKNGEYIESETTLPVIESSKNNSAQTLGMSITYMRRYTLCAMLGITSDEDVDANVPAQDNLPVPQKQNGKKDEKPKLKGGESTPEEKKIITELLIEKYEDNTPVFSKDEQDRYRKMREEFTAKELIEILMGEVARRKEQRKEKLKGGEPVVIGKHDQEEKVFY